MPVDFEAELERFKKSEIVKLNVTVKDVVFTPEQVKAAVDSAKAAVDSQMSAKAVLSFVLGIASKLGAIA